MKILSINAGSSSLKFSAYEMPEQKFLINGYFERIGMANSFYTIKINGEKIKKEVELSSHKDAFEYLVKELMENHVVESLDEIKALGHRVLQGGDIFESTVITDEVLAKIKKYIPIAPLHNPAAIVGIEAAKEVIPNATHVAVFDTSFHATIPEENYLYALPKSWYTDYQVRRYGFHGTSYRYITEAMQNKLGKETVNLIVCHIGNGASIAAIKGSKCLNTTMGFTPTAGLIMSSRCGDIDPTIITYMMEQGFSAEKLKNVMNKESGLYGICGYSDSREIEQGIANGDENCILAQKMFVRKIVNFIAQYYVELKGQIDGIVFTAGIGENSISTRKEILEELQVLGIHLDEEANSKIASYLEVNEGKITTEDSTVAVYVVPTNEELMMAKDTYKAVS